jgi:hypothetical protein
MFAKYSKCTDATAQLQIASEPPVLKSLFRGSTSRASERQALYWQPSAAPGLADLLRGRNREAEARAVLAPVYDRFTKGLSAAEAHRAKMLLDPLNLPCLGRTSEVTHAQSDRVAASERPRSRNFAVRSCKTVANGKIQ